MTKDTNFFYSKISEDPNHVIDLLDSERSPIKYKLIHFNDGEPHIELQPIDRKKVSGVIILTRIASADDLYILEELHDILRRQGLPIGSLVITYLMSMRMDRVFSLERPYNLSIMARHINALHAERVFVLEPHSGKVIELIENCQGLGVWSMIREAAGCHWIVAPDRGAQNRIIGQISKHEPRDNARLFSKTVLCCEKHRDEQTGRILSLEMDEYDMEKLKDNDEHLLVVDDLCDGGGTFLLLIDKLRQIKFDRQMSIFVTHAVNEAGLRKLAKEYFHVYTTNSYRDWQDVEDLPNNITIFKL